MFARTALATLVAITTGALLMSKSAEAAPAAAGAVAMLGDQSAASVLTEPAQYGYGYGYRRGYYRPRYYGGYGYAPRYYGGYSGYGYAPRYYGGGGYGGYGGY
jgi:hypothetical protein